MTQRDWTCLALSLCAGGFAAFVDMHASEVQPTVSTLLVLGVLLGFAQPRRWWLWGVTAGAALPLTYAAAALFGAHLAQWPQPNVGASALAIIPSMAASGLGAFVGK